MICHIIINSKMSTQIHTKYSTKTINKFYYNLNLINNKLWNFFTEFMDEICNSMYKYIILKTSDISHHNFYNWKKIKKFKLCLVFKKVNYVLLQCFYISVTDPNQDPNTKPDINCVVGGFRKYRKLINGEPIHGWSRSL